ncbi:MAG TPA: hypothetical protein VHO06_15425 [Polyangia bacterium]|nr:hypothetical protein [Polyangia bacterium]
MPARFFKIALALRDYQIECKTKKGKGSHALLVHRGSVYPVSLHNGEKTELSDVYVKGICRFFGIDYDEFKIKL